jgi:hypothetical protein
MVGPMNINSLKKIIGLSFICIILFSPRGIAQTITNVSPQAERGASFIQTIEVTWTTTPMFNNDTRVVVIGQPAIVWERISEWTVSMYSYHRGRITISMDVPAGSYKIRLTNSGFINACQCAESWLTVYDFSVGVSTASPNTVNAGDTNIPLTLNFSPSLKNWSSYTIQSVTSDNPAVSYVAGSGLFLSASQLRLAINIAPDSPIGALGLYIKYGPPIVGRERRSGNIGATAIRVTPNVPGDYATLFLDPSLSIVTIQQANPSIREVTPSIVSLGESNVQLSITGVNFSSGVTLGTGHSGVTFSNTQYISESQLISSVTVSSTASLGFVPIRVTNPDGRTSVNDSAFRVASKRPKFISVSNPVLLIGQSNQQVCISGENFYTGASVIFYSDYVRAREVRVLNSTSICMLVDVDANATAGGVSIAIFNPDGTNDRGLNAFLLSENASTDRTIQLLYPGINGGLPFVVNEANLTPTELIDTQYPVFRWYSLGWRFKISIYKPLAGQASFAEVIRNRPYYEAVVDGANYFLYPLQARALEPGVRYFWKVTAYFGTVPASYYDSSVTKGLDDTSFQGELKESEVWSFVLRENRPEGREEFRFGTLNPVDEIAIEPSYVEVAPGDRLILELRGYDRNHNLAAFIPGNFLIDLGDIERNYPDVKLLPKSFGRAELIVPNVKGNNDFRGRLLRNPAEFGRLPILLYISKKARGVGAVLAIWQNHRYYGFVNVLPPKKTMLENGEIDRFRIGVAERLSETFEVQLDSPAKAGAVISGNGRLFIDAAGFREMGYFPVTVEDVRLDTSGRAYTGIVKFEGARASMLAGFDLIIEKIGISYIEAAKIEGKLLLPLETQTEKIDFTGVLQATGDISARAPVNDLIRLAQANIPAKSIIEIDFNSHNSPEARKYSPEFRGLIIPVTVKDELSKNVVVTDPSQLTAIMGLNSIPIDVLKLDLNKINKFPLAETANGIYLTAVRNDSGAVQLSWQIKEEGLKLFNVYRRAEHENQYRLVGERVTADGFVDNHVYSDTSYWYKLAGLNGQSIETKTSKPIKIQ